MAIDQHPMTRSFVSPHICQLLVESGINHRTHFFWQLTAKGWDLRSYSFDPDNYYGCMQELLEQPFGTDQLPAFTSTDMSTLLPPYTITKMNQSLYILGTIVGGKQHEKKIEVRDERQPDVLALAVLESLRLKVLHPIYCIEVLAG